MFDRVASRYDLVNTVLSAGCDGLWRMATVSAIVPQPGERILDVAAGTGASSVALARWGAQVVAADFSSGMIAVGRTRHSDTTNVEFVRADAMALPFGDDEFDAVTISFGLRNIVDPHAALAEFLRVTKPGGRLVVCEFSIPPCPLVRYPYFWYLRTIMPDVTRLVSSDPEAYLYLADSIAAWPCAPELSSWIRGAGYRRVEHRMLTGGIVALHRATKPDGEGSVGVSS